MSSIDFCTLGMFILDEIEFEPPTPPVNDVIGGAGSFAVLGARIVAGRKDAHRIAWIVDTGKDFPDHVRETIRSWETHCVMRETPERLTTRAWNGYGANEKRDFEYLTPKIRLDHNSLSNSLLDSKTFHMVCSADRCCQIVDGILQRRNRLFSESNSANTPHQGPIFIWEPVPNLCRPDELACFYSALGKVDVVSPNDSELAQYFGKTIWDSTKLEDQEIAQNIVNAGIGSEGKGMLVVRAGSHGCCAFSQEKSVHIPACQGIKAVDPTGAGNAFLGALVEALVCTRQEFLGSVIDAELANSQAWAAICSIWGNRGMIPKALICATVAASFVIEQIGTPSVSAAVEEDTPWNGVNYAERLRQHANALRHIFNEKEKEEANVTE